VVISGGVAAAHDLLFPPLRAAIAEHGRLAFLRGLTVTTASLGNPAGLVGSAALLLAPEAYAGRGIASLASPGRATRGKTDRRFRGGYAIRS
jgi:glucokinase